MALRFDLQSGEAQVWRYWQLPELATEQEALDEAVLLDELETLLEDAVRGQMVADVPLGVLLSGGGFQPGYGDGGAGLQPGADLYYRLSGHGKLKTKPSTPG